MKRDDKRIILLFARYMVILLLAVPNLYIIYAVFTPVTIFLVSSVLRFFFSVSHAGSILLVNGESISLVKACIAGSAYYLLILLNLSAPMPLVKRVCSLMFSILAFLALNSARIIVFSALLVYNFRYFDFTHLLFWYVLSGVLVFTVYLASIKIFRIRKIPFYTDLSFLYRKIKRKKLNSNLK